jgi:hypothetical protein
VSLELGLDESVILLSGDVPDANAAVRWSDAGNVVPLRVAPWQLSTALSEAYPAFTPWRTLESLVNLCQPGLLPDFSGTIRYETTFAMHNDLSDGGRDGSPSRPRTPRRGVPTSDAITASCDGSSRSGQVFLDLGEVGEVAQAWLNGTSLGTRICRPYVFDATSAIRSGENKLRIEVTNTLVYTLKDDFSRYINQNPSGLVGPVRLRYRD